MDNLHIAVYTSSTADALIDLWCACFQTDSPEYVHRFMRALPSDTLIVVGEVATVPVTMACLLPATATVRDKRYVVRYLYAGCTHPSSRGNGYYRQVMDAAYTLVRDKGESAIYLHPANSKLTHSYYRMGYLPGIVSGTVGQLRHVNDLSSYCDARKVLLRRLSQEIVTWELSPTMVSFFLADAVSNGAKMSCTDTAVCLYTADGCVDALSAALDNNTEYCLWIPTDASDLQNEMLQHGGVTGVVGD